MDEKEFSKLVAEKLRNLIGGYQVKTGDSVVYKLIVDGSGKIKPPNIRYPARGQYAFETDILIQNEKVPLIIVEVKLDSFTTHDVLTYSTKAKKHKEVYPFLRYGFLIGNRDRIDGRFFTHNTDLDFALAMPDFESGVIQLADIVREQLQVAERLISILDGSTVSRFETRLHFD